MVFWLALCSSLLAEDLQVNTYTTHLQSRPVLAIDGDGDFVVVWDSYGSSSNDLGSHSIQLRRYTASGTPLGSQVQVNTYTTGNQFDPAVAMNSAGDFVIAWESLGSSDTDTSSYSVQGRFYAPSGVPLGGQFQVNTHTTGRQSEPAVAMRGDGDFVVVWASNGSTGTDTSGYSIQSQFYDANGVPILGQFQVNTYSTSDQFNPAIGMNSDGDFVVVWESNGSSGTDKTSLSIQGQLYASSGTPIGGQFQVNTYTTGSQCCPAVAMRGDGGFVVVWGSEGSSGTDTSSFSIQGQFYFSSGVPIGGQFQVNGYTTGFQGDPKVATGGDGGFVVVWDSVGSVGTDTSSVSVQARRYASNGAALGGQFQINSYTTSYQQSSDAAIRSEGDFVVVWSSNGSHGTDTSYTSIQAFLSHIFSDGFESGNTSAWSSAVP